MTQNAKIPENSDKPIGYSERRKRLLLLLPKHGFKIAPAAIEAGFSENYARKSLPGRLKQDEVFSWQLKRMRDENLACSADEVGALDAKADYILDTCTLPDGQKVPPTVYYRFVELRYKRLGALKDAATTPDVDRPRLTPEQIEGARKQARRMLESGVTRCDLATS